MSFGWRIVCSYHLHSPSVHSLILSIVCLIKGKRKLQVTELCGLSGSRYNFSAFYPIIVYFSRREMFLYSTSSLYPPEYSCTFSPLFAVSFNNRDCFITLVQLWPTYSPSLRVYFLWESGTSFPPPEETEISLLSLSFSPILHLEYESSFYPGWWKKNAASTVVSAWIKLRTSLLPRLTENETEFRRYTHFFFFLLFFRTSWRNRVNRGEERRKSLTFSFSLFFSFSLSRVSLLVKISRNSVGWLKKIRKIRIIIVKRGEFLLSSCIFT